MRRPAIIVVAALLSTAFFTACQKDTDGKENEPHIVICYLEPWVPIRVINTKGEDLLDPSKLPGGRLEIKWEIPGTNMSATKLNPAIYHKNGQPDQYFASAPLTNADKGLSVYFSIKAGDTDTLFIKTAANSSRPYGVTEVAFNGVKIEPKILFDTQYGIEIVKGGAGY